MPESLLSPELTPRRIVEELDRHIIGQVAAKRAVAIALRNRWRRQLVDEELRDEIMPKNIIMIGPTGVGKSEIARRLARLARAPFLKVEASKFTEVGYVGRDVESMIRDLVELAVTMVKAEASSRVASRAREAAEELILDQLEPRIEPERPSLREPEEVRKAFIVGQDGVVQRDVHVVDRRELLLRRLRRGDLDAEHVEIELTPTSPSPISERLGLHAERVSADLSSVLEGMLPKKAPRKKRVRVRDAMAALMHQETARLLDMDQIIHEALVRTQQGGIIFLDEIDKIAGRESGKAGPDVSREGVQRDLLPIVEGSSVTTKYGVVKTDHILFIAAGAFHVTKPSELIPELQGRFPIRVELESLTREDLRRILVEPRHSLTRQTIALLRTEGVEVSYTPEAIDELALLAWRVNQSLENIGARRLHTIMEKVCEELSFDAPELRGQRVVIDAAYIRQRLQGILQDEDMSRYIL